MIDGKGHYYKSDDGLKLYAKIYDGSGSKDTILCMHGLTRNSSDFDIVAEHLCDRYRVISVDQRGRGNSEWDSDVSQYNPAIYVQDMLTLLDGLGIDKVALIGTSMGGLMSMMMGAMVPQRILGMVINDIGPVIETEGLERIKNYIGNSSTFDSWQQIADNSKELHGVAFPNYTNDDWLRMAERTGRMGDDGIIRMNYDQAIAEAIRDSEEAAIPPDLWPLFDMLAGKELLTIRGEISDILGSGVLADMVKRHEGMETHIVAGEGHAPMMEDPATLASIDLWAKRVFG